VSDILPDFAYLMGLSKAHAGHLSQLRLMGLDLGSHVVAGENLLYQLLLFSQTSTDLRKVLSASRQVRVIAECSQAVVEAAVAVIAVAAVVGEAAVADVVGEDVVADVVGRAGIVLAV